MFQESADRCLSRSNHPSSKAWEGDLYLTTSDEGQRVNLSAWEPGLRTHPQGNSQSKEQVALGTLQQPQAGCRSSRRGRVSEASERASWHILHCSPSDHTNFRSLISLRCVFCSDLDNKRPVFRTHGNIRFSETYILTNVSLMISESKTTSSPYPAIKVRNQARF